MKNMVTWFEIPTGDLDRAARFYEAVIGVSLWRETVAGVPHAIFPVEVVMPATLLDNIGTIAAIRDLDHNTVGLHASP